jgi:hypothetical protein
MRTMTASGRASPLVEKEVSTKIPFRKPKNICGEERFAICDFQKTKYSIRILPPEDVVPEKTLKTL